MSRYTLFATLLLVACGTVVEPVCGCSPPTGGTAVIRGVVRSPAGAPVAGATVHLRLMQDLTCEEPAFNVSGSVQSSASGEYRHSTSWSGGRKCFRLWAEPPQGSSLTASAGELVRIDFTDRPVPDTVELALHLR